MKTGTGKLHWIRMAATAALVLLFTAGMLVCRGFVEHNGVVFRKRVALFVLLVAAALAAALFSPDKAKRWKYGSLLYVPVGICAGALAFQHFTVTGYHGVIRAEYLPLVLSLSAVVFVLVWCFVRDARAAVVVYFWLMCALGYAYYCVFQFRGIAFKPSDVASIGTALAVANNYQYPLEYRHMFWCMGGLLLWTLSGWIAPTAGKTWRAIVGKLACVAASAGWICLLLFTSVLDQWGVKTTAFEADALFLNWQQGTLSTLMKESWILTSYYPDDYSASGLLLEDERFAAEGILTEGEREPHVIVVVNESLADLTTLWDIQTDADPMQNIRALGGSAVWGNLYVSSYGGSTCNTEHSFLSATIPMPQANVPLLSTVKEATPTLAWYMKSLGYTAIAAHPNLASNYQRDEIYPLLGFDRFVAGDDFAGMKKIRTYTSDEACYEKIISLYEQRAQDEKLFIYMLTMQNHGGYYKGEVERRVQMSNPNDPELQRYLDLVSVSDQAFQMLTDYFAQQDEPVIILMFGDHQPNLNLSSYPKQTALTHAEQLLTQQITPFIIWANWTVEPKYVEALSVNYLAPLLLKTAGLPMTGYDEWLLETAQEYPVVLLNGYVNDQQQFTQWDEKERPYSLTLMDQLRHNRLYDRENRLPALQIPAMSEGKAP